MVFETKDAVWCLLGAAIGFGASAFFYMLGATDAQLSSWRGQILGALLYLKQTDPCRHTLGSAHCVGEAQNFCLCLAETLKADGYKAGHDTLTLIASELGQLPQCGPEPTKPEKDHGEEMKHEFYEHLLHRLDDFERTEFLWQMRLERMKRSWLLRRFFYGPDPVPRP